MIERSTTARLLSVVAIFCWLAYSVYKVPDFQDCLGEHQESYKRAEKVDEYPSGPVGFVINARHDTICTFVLVDEYHDGAIAIATIFIALFTLTLWLSTNRLSTEATVASGIAKQAANAATKAADTAEAALLVGERPYIFVTDLQFLTPLSRTVFFGGALEPDVWTKYFIELVNHGRTPAEITEFCCESECVKELPAIPEYRENRTDKEVRLVYENGKKEQRGFIFKTPIDGQLVNDIGSPDTRRLFAFGYVKYDDIFGYTHTVGYCWRYYLDLKRFLPEDNHAYNYRRTERKTS